MSHQSSSSPPETEAEEYEDERLRGGNQRLRRLYPSMRERDHDISLPRRWDLAQASSYLELSPNGLTVAFKKNASLQGDKDPSGVVRADAPIPSSIGLYYFEVRIVHGHRGCMGVGLSRTGGELNRMPGWDTSCYGYHGDDGNFFAACGHGTPYGPKFGTGDVIGCGVDTMLYQVFFTKNGKHLGVAFQGTTPFEELYPTVGLKTPGEQLHVNFGQKPFMFDFEGVKDTLNRKKMDLIESTPMPEEIGSFMDRIVLSFLGDSGAHNTFEKFAKIAKKDDENLDFLRKRKEVVDMIMNADHGAAIHQKMNTYFPLSMEKEMRVRIMIMCLRYIDLANTLRDPPPSFRRPVSETGQPLSPTELRSKPQKRTRDGSSDNNKKSIFEYRAERHHQYDDEDTGEQMIIIDGISLTKAMYLDLNTSGEFEKLEYIIKMGRDMQELANSMVLTKKEREILETSMAMALSTNRVEKHPLSTGHRRYIANLVTKYVNYIHKEDKKREEHTDVYSELRGMFLAWQGVHSDAAARDHPAAALSFMRRMVVEQNGIPQKRDILYSEEPMEVSGEEQT